MTHTTPRRRPAVAIVAALMLLITGIALPAGAAHAGEPTLVKSLAQTQPFANEDGTFPSGSIVTYEVSIGCNAPGDCNGFELHDLAPSYTDVDGDPAVFEFVSASPGGVGPSFEVDTSDPSDIVFTFPNGFAAGTSANLQISFEIPAGVTPDLTTATNTAVWGEFDGDGNPLPNTVIDTQDVTARARTSFDVTKTGPARVAPNEPVVFTVALCGDNPDDPYYGPLNGSVEGATLTDEIPEGFVVVDAGGGVDNGDGTVTWLLGDVQVGVDECIERSITLEYPADAPLPAPIETSNVVVAGGTFPPGSDGNPGGDEFPFVVDNREPGDPTIDKAAGRPFVDLDLNDGTNGDDGDSFSSYYLRPENEGEGVIFDAVLTDPLPGQFTMTELRTGTWPAGPTGPNGDGQVEFVVTLQDATTISLFADGASSQTITVPAPDTNPAEFVEVRYGDLPAGWIQDNGSGRTDLYGYFIDPGRDGGDGNDFDTTPVIPVVNTATLSGTVLDPVTGAPLPASDSDSATINIESPQPHVAIFKDVTATGNNFGNGVFPSSDTTTTTLTWRLRVQNHWTATADYPDPVIMDVVPTLSQNLLAEGGLSAPYDFTVSAPDGVTCPATPVDGGTVPNAGTGLDDSVLRWECAGDLERNRTITITFKTDVEAGTPPQSVLNRNFTTTNALTDDAGGQYFSVWDNGNFFGTWQDDVDDLDGDGETDDRIRADLASIEVLDFVFLTSQKEVRGGPDATCADGFPPAGEDNTTYGSERCTRPGDTVDYRMTVVNEGNTDVINVMVMDIFPYVGDTFVVPNQNTGAVSPRGSQFDTNLTGPVTSPDPNVVIEYTTERQPCRYDDFYPAFAGNAEVPGCAEAAWSTTPPSPISSAAAIRISYVDDATGEPGVLALGESFQLEWPMRASVAAVPGDVATNAFGWSAQSATSNTVNTAAPPPVDITVAELGDHFVGDQVWYDADYDGVQDEAPLVGVPQVPVAIFLDNNGNGVLDADDLFVDETVTDSSTGVEGQYLFSALPEGDYFIAFAPPSDWVVSPAFEGGDSAADSNGTEEPAFPTGLWDPAAVNGPLYDDVFVSDMVTLGPDNPSADNPNDLTIDLGLWRPDPSISIEKATNAIDVDAPTAADDADSPTGKYIPEGEDVVWSYVVTNTGNTVLENVVVTDDAGTPADPSDDLSTTAGTITCPVATLAIGESTTCTSTTPAPAEAGQYDNTADVVGDPVLPDIPWSEESYADLVRLDGSPFFDGDGNVVPVVDDDPSHYFGAVATIDIEKSTNDVPADAVGTDPAGPIVPTLDPVTWTYVVTIPAPGNVALADVTIVDDNGTPADTSDDITTDEMTFVGGDADGDGLLDVDETWTFEADAPNGAILGIYENSADVIGTPVEPDGTPIVNPDGTPMEQPVDDDPSHYYGIAVPAIDIEKSTNDVPADLPGSDPAGPEILAGSDVYWTYVIANTGNVDLEVTSFTDDQIGTIATCEEDAIDTVFPTVIAPGASVTCTAREAGGADLGQYVNTADVTGTPLDGDGEVITENQTPDGPIPVEPPSDDDPSNYLGVGEPGIAIDKVTSGFLWDADLSDFVEVAAGDGITVSPAQEVTWIYTVTNTGDFALADVAVVDDNGTVGDESDDLSTEAGTIVFVDGDVDGDGLLDVDEVWVYRATGASALGTYENLADTVGTATDPEGNPIVDQDGENPFVDDEGNSTIVDDDPSGYVAVGEPGIAIDKVTAGYLWDRDLGELVEVPAGDGITVSPGREVTWIYTVTNTGDFALADVAVVDDNGTVGDESDDLSTEAGTIVFVDGDVDGDGLLDVDEVWVYRATGASALGTYENLADTVGTATDPEGNPMVDQDGENPFVDDEGNSTIVDDDPSGYVAVADPSIDIEKTTNGFQADDPAGDQADPNNTVPYVLLDQPIVWEYVITNTGDVDLFVTGFGDDRIDGVDAQCTEGTIFPVTLTPGTSITCTVEGVSEAQAGDLYVNVSDVEGIAVDPAGDPIVDQDGVYPFVDDEGTSIIVDDDPSAYYGASPAIDLEKATNGQDADTGTGPFVALGGSVTWTYVVTNTGNTDLADLAVVDSVEGDVCTIEFLAIGESTTCELALEDGSTLVGQYENTGNVTGQPVDQQGNPIIDPVTGEPEPPIGDSDPSHYFGAEPAIDVEKSTNGVDADEAPGPVVPIGDVVVWEYVVTNTGNVALTNVVVTDDLEGEICVIDLLLVGASETCELTSFATVDGQYANVADVVGTPSFPVDPDGDPEDPTNYTPIVDPDTDQPIDDVVDDDPSHYTGAVASIDIEKSTNGEDADEAPGPEVDDQSEVVWEYVVTNTGAVALVDVIVTDDREGFVCELALLLPGEVATCELVGVADESDYANVGSVVGTPATPIDPTGDPTDPTNYEPIPGASPVFDDDPSHYDRVNLIGQSPVPPTTLPRTGSDVTGTMLQWALAAVGLGAVGLLLARRRRPAAA